MSIPKPQPTTRLSLPSKASWWKAKASTRAYQNSLKALSCQRAMGVPKEALLK